MPNYGLRYNATPMNVGDMIASAPDDIARMRLENQQREQMRQAALAEYAGQATAGQPDPVTLFKPLPTPQSANPLAQPAGNTTMDQNAAARQGAQLMPQAPRPSAPAAADLAQIGQAQRQQNFPAASAPGSVDGPAQGPLQPDAAGIEEMRQKLRQNPDRMLMQQHLSMLGFSPGAISNLFAAAPLNPGTLQELGTAGQNGFKSLPQFASGTQTADYAREKSLEAQQAASGIQSQKSDTAERVAQIRADAMAASAKMHADMAGIKLDPATRRGVSAALPLATLLDNDIRLYNSYQMKPDDAMYDQVTETKLARMPWVGDYLNANPDEPYQKLTTADKSRFLSAMELASAVSGNSGRGVNPQLVHEFFNALPGPDTPPKQAAYMFQQAEQQAFGRTLGGVAFEQGLSNPGSPAAQRYKQAELALRGNMSPVFGIQYNPQTHLPIIPDYGQTGEEFGSKSGGAGAPPPASAPAAGPGAGQTDNQADSLRAPADAPDNLRRAWASRLSKDTRQKVLQLRQANVPWDAITGSDDLKGRIK